MMHAVFMVSHFFENSGEVFILTSSTCYRDQISSAVSVSVALNTLLFFFCL